MQKFIGIIMVISAIVIHIINISTSGVNFLMDSELKIAMTLIGHNPLMFFLAMGLFFGGMIIPFTADNRSISKRKLRRNTKNHKKNN